MIYSDHLTNGWNGPILHQYAQQREQIQMEELAIIKGPGFGLRDTGRPCLWFLVDTLDGGSLQVFYGDQAYTIIKEANVYDVKDLEGKPCVVTSNNGIQTFVRMK